MNFRQLKIGQKLALAFASVLALLVALSALAWYSLNASQQAMKHVLVMEERSVVTDEWVANTRLNAARVIALAKSNNNTDVDSYFKPLIEETSARISTLQKRLDAEIASERGRGLLTEIGQNRKAYIDTRNEFFKVLLAGDSFNADRMLEADLLPAIEKYLASMTLLQDYERELVAKAVAVSDATVDRQEMIIMVLAALAVALAVVVAWRITRSITEPLKEAVSVASAVAAGDLTQRVETNRKDELGELITALGAMKTSLVNTVGQVRAATDSINTASLEIASGNQDLSARTEQAASNLEETAASMEQLTSTVRQSADAARQANQLASSAAEIAARGGQVVGQVVTTMDEINHSSKKISDIIGVIDGIAFQTNILALNAAVEAARAGEQGRGFAVVAGEVRNLAQRSAEAAKEIKGLIGASVDKVEAGSKLVADAGQTMSEIVGSVQRVSDIIGEITAASGEQSDGIGQVNVAVTQLDQMTQQNAALVEESAAAAESLKDQAQRLAQVIQIFKLEASAQAALPAPVRQASKPQATASLPAPKAKPALAAPKAAHAPAAAPAAPELKRPQPTGTPARAAAGAEGDWESF